jgi:type II secretory pathway predicted ATPase ExeA
MNANEKPDLRTPLSTLWGAKEMPFGEDSGILYRTAESDKLLQGLEQMTWVHASGILYGPNGVGKSYLVNRFLKSLNPKSYLSVVLSHSSLAGSGLLRMLAHLLGKRPRFRREDNICALSAAFEEIKPLWPVILLEEAQNLSADALEEFRLLSLYNNQSTKAPFSFILIGDEALLPKLMLKINAPVITRPGYSFKVCPFSYDECKGYLQSRLEEVSIFSEPFEPAVIDMLIEACGGVPRLLNHLAARSLQAAAMDNQERITGAHFEQALESMPWLSSGSMGSIHLKGGQTL